MEEKNSINNSSEISKINESKCGINKEKKFEKLVFHLKESK